MIGPLVSVVVPTRRHESVELTVRSLAAQSCQDFEVHVVVDSGERGAPWARNRGAERARGKFILFSDSDVDWDPTALDTMVSTLERAMLRDAEAIRAEAPPRFRTAYAYGGYRTTFPAPRASGAPHANASWDFATLKYRNVASTMALVYRDAFTGFDETLARLQDWDLWLGMALNADERGEWVGRILFTTPYREDGISAPGRDAYVAAWQAVRRKYGLSTDFLPQYTASAPADVPPPLPPPSPTPPTPRPSPIIHLDSHRRRHPPGGRR
jgi:glycosyltransferase involved in cell wall biosynthesis